jgi:Caspase domain
MLTIAAALGFTNTSPAFSCPPERFKSYCRDQPVVSRLLSVVWPNSAPYQIAVVAGIARYPNLPRDQQLPPVDYDVGTLSTLLRDNLGFDEVIILKDRDFSRDNLRYLFSDYIPSQLQGRKNSQVLFAYSGHGADFRNTGYLFLSDTPTIDPHSYGDIDNALDMDELKVLMKPTIREATHFLALLNSCKGGYFVEADHSSLGRAL